ncbi:hypothetical protein Gohar_013425, partial [Gossypium harknessii]|nr:hypothetical protein [Gossypium harknessii]
MQQGRRDCTPSVQRLHVYKTGPAKVRNNSFVHRSGARMEAVVKYYPELYKKRETKGGGQQIEEWLKKNFDASYQGHQNRSISSIIIRNNEGLVMASCVYPVANVRDLTMIEAWVCFQAVTFIEKLGFRDVCVEGDALTIIRKLRDREND